MTDLVERITEELRFDLDRDVAQVLRDCQDEITRLQSALTEAQAQGEVMREALEKIADGEVGILGPALPSGASCYEWYDREIEKNKRLTAIATEALSSTPPTAVARVIEAARSARVLIDVLAEWERQNGSLDAGLVFPNDGKSLVETINARAEPGTGFRPLSEALAGLDGGRKG